MNNTRTTKNNKKGFTIVELMIATVIFSLIMVMCLTGMVQVSRAYYKGITHSRTQEAARLLMDEISQTIRLSGSNISYQNSTSSGPLIAENRITDGAGLFCAGNKLYTYALDRKVVGGSSNESLKEIKNAIISEDVSCPDGIEMTPAQLGKLNLQVAGTQRSILGENMRLTKFSVTQIVPAAPIKEGGELWKIDISIAYGDQDLIRYTDDNGINRVVCNAGTGTEFCSIVELSTIVSRRIG
jgi:prepilin-type N-terminal cleavage/methylation domain-containing protein